MCFGAFYSVLLDWCVYFLCQYNSVLIMTLQYYCSYVVWKMWCLNFLLLSQIALDIWELLWFQTNLGITICTSVQKCHWTFGRDSIKSIDDFGYCEHFNNINQLILIYQIINQSITCMSNLSIYLCFQLALQFSLYGSSSSLATFILPKYFIVWCKVNGIVFCTFSDIF